MERGEYVRLAAAEERMWWFRGLRANLLAELVAAMRANDILMEHVRGASIAGKQTNGQIGPWRNCLRRRLAHGQV